VRVRAQTRIVFGMTVIEHRRFRLAGTKCASHPGKILGGADCGGIQPRLLSDRFSATS